MKSGGAEGVQEKMDGREAGGGGLSGLVSDTWLHLVRRFMNARAAQVK